jgi:formimidoylglutamate deiminase
MTIRNISLNSALLPDGWHDDVLIELDDDGIIAALQHNNNDSSAPKVDGFAIPAIPNIHSHAHQRAMTGLAEVSGPGADSFWTWREVMYGFAGKMGPDELEAIAAQLYVETLKSGSSIIGEFQYLHHQPDGTSYDETAEMSLRCLSAAETAGIAITILPTLYNYGGFGGQPSTEGQRRFVNDADRYLGILETLHNVSIGHPLRQIGISPHSLRAVTKELLQEVITGLNDLDDTAPIHIHVAEQVKEVDDCIAWSNGARPVEYMLGNLDVTGRWCAIHATHMTDQETDQLARSGCIAGLCPTTEANLGDGTFNAGRFLDAGGVIALGSDSHVSVSPAEDIRQLEYSQRLKYHARNVLAGGPDRSTGRTLFEATVSGGAAAMAQNAGTIEVGKRFDVAILDPGHPALIGRSGDQVLDSWIFSGGNACIRDVYVAGQKVVQDHRHIREDEILANFQAAITRLQKD